VIELYDMHCVGYVCVTQLKILKRSCYVRSWGSRAVILLKLSRSSG
jgi:hypothetical protein